jgi:hypothetical protein
MCFADLGKFQTSTDDIFTVTPVKKIRPRKIHFTEARSHMVHDVHPAALPSWFYIVMLIGAVKPPAAPPLDHQRVPSARWWR